MNSLSAQSSAPTPTCRSSARWWILRSCTAGCVANFSSGGLLRDVYCCVTTSISLHPGCPPGAARAHNATTSARERCDYRAARRSLRLGSIPRPIVLSDQSTQIVRSSCCCCARLGARTTGCCLGLRSAAARCRQPRKGGSGIAQLPTYGMGSRRSTCRCGRSLFLSPSDPGTRPAQRHLSPMAMCEAERARGGHGHGSCTAAALVLMHDMVARAAGGPVSLLVGHRRAAAAIRLWLAL